MARVVPWNIDGVDFDAREAAKAAARRAGVSLGEWLNGVIAERATDLGVGFGDDLGIDDDSRLEAVAARLASLAKQSRVKSPRAASLRRSDRGTPRSSDADRCGVTMLRGPMTKRFSEKLALTRLKTIPIDRHARIL